MPAHRKRPASTGHPTSILGCAPTASAWRVSAIAAATLLQLLSVPAVKAVTFTLVGNSSGPNYHGFWSTTHNNGPTTGCGIGSSAPCPNVTAVNGRITADGVSLLDWSSGTAAGVDQLVYRIGATGWGSIGASGSACPSWPGSFPSNDRDRSQYVLDALTAPLVFRLDHGLADPPILSLDLEIQWKPGANGAWSAGVTSASGGLGTANLDADLVVSVNGVEVARDSLHRAYAANGAGESGASPCPLKMLSGCTNCCHPYPPGSVLVHAVHLGDQVTVGARFRTTADAIINACAYSYDATSGGAGGLSVTISVRNIVVGVPLPEGRVARFELQPPAPNPARTGAAVVFTIPAGLWVSAQVFDLQGRAVRTLADREFEAGVHSLAWDGSDDLGREVGSGIYLVRVTAGRQTLERRLAFVR
jgi:hypothetical protein